MQLLYRSTSITGKPTVNVTSVVKPWWYQGTPKLIAYGSFYDSLDPRDQPSMAIAGNSNATLGGALPNVEALLVLPLLSAGYTVSIADTEGQDAAFGAGPVYGMNTLDGLRAASNAPETGLDTGTKIGLIGYSGGAIATEWAAELAPDYAPEINSQLVGATMGGVLVHPDHNLRYIEGSTIWAGVMPMALVGISRAFEVDLTPYMSEYGKELFVQKQYASITDALFQFPGLRFSQLTKPAVPDAGEHPGLRRGVQQADHGLQPHAHNAAADLPGRWRRGRRHAGAAPPPGIGPGDGVMVAGDVRSLARKYCAKGVDVEHKQFDSLSHVGATSPWLDASLPWLNARFAGQPAPKNCARSLPATPSIRCRRTWRRGRRRRPPRRSRTRGSAPWRRCPGAALPTSNAKPVPATPIGRNPPTVLKRRTGKAAARRSARVSKRVTHRRGLTGAQGSRAPRSCPRERARSRRSARGARSRLGTCAHDDPRRRPGHRDGEAEQRRQAPAASARQGEAARGSIRREEAAQPQVHHPAVASAPCARP